MKANDTNKPSISGKTTITFNQGALKLKDACRYLGGISPTSIRRLIKRKLLTPNRSLRHIIIPISELDRFLGEGEP